jgi:hypothetical protein
MNNKQGKQARVKPQISPRQNGTRPLTANQSQTNPQTAGGLLTGAPSLQSLPNLPATQRLRQLEIGHIQRQYGNKYAQRQLAQLQPVKRVANNGRQTLIQRADDQVARSPQEAASQAVSEGKDNAWDGLVETRLEQFLHDFSNIPVKVQWEEDGKTKTKTVMVHPPYYINTKEFTASKKRMEAAEKHRKEATGSSSKAPVESSWHARHGKSTPEEIQKILQTAVDTNKIETPEGKDYPDGGDLRDWLVKYGIGIDCSGFVSQALNAVMIELHEQAGLPTKDLEKLSKGSGGLKGGAKGFSKVTKPADLRPGDTMHTPGHIRIVMGVEQTDQAVVFTTGESRSGSKGNIKDIGLDRVVWRYTNADKFEKLQKQSGSSWSTTKSSPTYGRYEVLTKFQAENVPPTPATEEAPAAETPERPETEKLQDVRELITGAVNKAGQFAGRVASWVGGLWSGIGETAAQPATSAEVAGESQPVAEEPGKAALNAALAAGLRDEIKLTDLVFYARHPERVGKPLDPVNEKSLVTEWRAIRNQEVRPLLTKAEETPLPEATEETPAEIPAVTVTFGANADASIVSDYTLTVLKEILHAAGESSALISSTARDAYNQARVMYNNIESKGVAHQKALYGPNGRKVIDVYAASKAEGKDRAAIIADMEAKVIELGPSSVSRHCADQSILGVIDVAPSSIKNKQAFETAVAADSRVSKCLKPPADPGFHLEIPQ